MSLREFNEKMLMISRILSYAVPGTTDYDTAIAIRDYVIDSRLNTALQELETAI